MPKVSLLYEIDFFAHCPASLVWPRVFYRALGSGARRRAACTHGVSLSLGPGRAPWRVLWAGRRFFVFSQKLSVGFGCFLKKKKNKTEKNETEPEHFPVGFSVGLTVKPTINKNLPGV